MARVSVKNYIDDYLTESLTSQSRQEGNAGILDGKIHYRINNFENN